MFQFFKRKNRELYAPVEGKCIDITKVKDITFSKKMLGDGIAVIPEKNCIKAPCDGKIIMLFPTLHALGIQMQDGTEILIHIGINTVELNGKGFYSNVKVNDRVKAGEVLVRFDEDYLTGEYDMTTVIVYTKKDGEIEKYHLEENVTCNQVIMKLRDKNEAAKEDK